MLTSQQLLDMGIKPGPLFGKCLKRNSIEEALELVAQNTTKKECTSNGPKMTDGTLWHWLCNSPLFSNMCSIEMPGKVASNSEKKRWIEQRCVLINGTTDWCLDDFVPRINQLVFFPKSDKRRCTMV